MSKLPGPATEFVERYLIRIRDRMIELFGINSYEAEGRIASAFGSLDLLDEETERFIAHELPDYWAKSIYYQDDQWWLKNEDELEPRPWPG